MIADVARENFGFDVTPLRELIHWANIVDGAKYESATGSGGDGSAGDEVDDGDRERGGPCAGAEADSTADGDALCSRCWISGFVQELLGPLMERHLGCAGVDSERATVERGVITFDITDQPTEGYNKFIPYYLHPEATYNVGLSKSSFRMKVSVGTNPWTKKPVSELVNLAEICERYGGGGHARVGAISFPPDEEEDARKAVGEIVAELRDGCPY